MLIWMPEKMNLEASNKLLKTLEEPPEKTIFLLVSEDRFSLLKTIKSRVQLIKTPAFTTKEIVDYLEEKNIVFDDIGTLEKITNSEVPIKSLLNGISLPEAVVVLKVPPSVAKKRYEQRGVNGQGRLIRVNSEEYFNRAEELQKKLIGYCIDRQVKTIEVDSRYEFTEEYLSKKLSEIQNVFKNQRI